MPAPRVPDALLYAVWRLDMGELRAAFSERTAAIVINTPQVRMPPLTPMIYIMFIASCCATRAPVSRAASQRGRGDPDDAREYSPPMLLCAPFPRCHTQNPTGKIFSRDELTGIADILRDFPRVVAISDEVRGILAWAGWAHLSPLCGCRLPCWLRGSSVHERIS